MESFYGGRQGASFIIKKKFEYLNLEDPAYLADHGFIEYKGIQDDKQHYFVRGEDGSLVSSNSKFDKVMELCLADESYKDVWYNEYCIIDTINKNNPNNGRIFRRRFPDQVTDGLPYEEIGTIVGPSSGAPMLKPQSGLLNFDTIRSQLPAGHWDGLGLSENGTLKIYDPSFSDGDLSTWPSTVTLKEESITIDNMGMVPGAVVKGEYKNGVFENTAVEYTDEIKYNWFNVRKNTENGDGVVESWCYIGFKIPYPVFSTSAIYKTPGTQPKAYEVNRNDNTDSIEHPFWYDWRFEIPGGLRGISIEEIFINDIDVKDNNNNNLYEVSAYVFDDLDYDTVADRYTFKPKAAPKPYTDRGWFCKARILNPSATTDSPELLKQTDNSDTVTFFLGEITEIDNVTLDTETGHLEFIYHNQKTDSYDLRYPIDVRMKEETGHVEVDYSLLKEDGTHTKDEWNFRYPINIDIKPDEGKFTTTYSREQSGVAEIGNNVEVVNFRYPIEIDFDKITDNDYQGLEPPTPIEYNNGKYTITYSYADKAKGEEKIESDQLGFVRKVSITEDSNGENGSITFVNTIDKQNQTYPFSYPQTLTLKSETGEWAVEYFGAKNTSGQIDFVDKAFIDSNTGKITFHHTKVTEGVTDTNGNFTQDFIYPKLFELDPDTGQYIIHYSNSNNNTPGHLVFPKTVKIDEKGVFSYTNSANDTVFQENKIVFIDDIFVDSAHQLWIAYTDNNQIESKTGLETKTFEDKNKTYINYGQTIGKLGIVSGPNPPEEYRDSIESIVNYYNENYKLGIIPPAEEPSGQLHVVTTLPLTGVDNNELLKKAISYFVMWNPNTGAWYSVSEIAGSPIGIPAQIGSDSDSWTYQDSLLLADGYVRFVSESVNTLTEKELTAENPVYWK